MVDQQYDQIPFPYTIIEGAGIGYAVGLAVSSPYHFIRAPQRARLASVAMKAPKTAGSFAVWSGLYDTFSGSVAHVRHKEDPWNSIWGGALTSGLLSLRAGPRTASVQFLWGGLFFAAFEGVQICAQRVFADVEARQQVQVVKAETDYLGGNKGRKSTGDKGGDTVLESVDTSPPPLPSFEYQ